MNDNQYQQDDDQAQQNQVAEYDGNVEVAMDQNLDQQEQHYQPEEQPVEDVTQIVAQAAAPVADQPDEPVEQPDDGAIAVVHTNEHTEVQADEEVDADDDDVPFDVLSIGDIVTDAFIQLEDDQAVTYENDEGKWLAMKFGAKLPFHHADVVQAVGNAANAAVAFARLGCTTEFATNVGDDQEGRDMVAALQREKVSTGLVHINAGFKSNYHYVLRYGAERTILVKHEDYNYHWPHLRPSEMPRWVYFSSISEKAIPYHDEVVAWLKENPKVKLAFQPGTFQMEAGAERLKELYQLTELVVLNREEAVTVGGGDWNNVHDLIDKLHALGPKIVVVTDGPNGAYASDGHDRFKMPLYPDPGPPVDRTGAGDAFASTFVAALARGNTIEGALQWAPINSMSVVQQIGAQAGLLPEEKIEKFLEQAPDWYKPERF